MQYCKKNYNTINKTNKDKNLPAMSHSDKVKCCFAEFSKQNVNGQSYEIECYHRVKDIILWGRKVIQAPKMSLQEITRSAFYLSEIFCSTGRKANGNAWIKQKSSGTNGQPLEVIHFVVFPNHHVHFDIPMRLQVWNQNQGCLNR